MNLEFSAADLAFRDEVRAFIAEQLPRELSERVRGGLYFNKYDCVTWQKILYRKGWIAPGWPPAHGGTGWTPTQRYIFEDECARANAPQVSPFGITMVGPVIYTFGDAEQKARFLPRILASEDWWCQGYSEPGAGSDLASLATRAEDDGDHYLVNGQKIWTTTAHLADWMFCLVRTGTAGKPQEGISFLLIDMTTPGITVEPIISMDKQHSLNQVFFRDVRVPKENLVGEENQGWTVAKFLLGHERTGIAGVARTKQRLLQLKAIAAAERAGGGRLIDDPSFSLRMAQAEIALTALEYTDLRELARAAGDADDQPPGPMPSVLKIRGSEIQQTIWELLVEAIGYYALPYEPVRIPDGRNEPPAGPRYAAGVVEEHLHGRAATIYGGSNEIQRNIVAKMVLGA